MVGVTDTYAAQVRRENCPNGTNQLLLPCRITRNSKGLVRGRRSMGVFVVASFISTPTTNQSLKCFTCQRAFLSCPAKPLKDMDRFEVMIRLESALVQLAAIFGRSIRGPCTWAPAQTPTGVLRADEQIT